jgi:hypothetical protein
VFADRAAHQRAARDALLRDCSCDSAPAAAAAAGDLSGAGGAAEARLRALAAVERAAAVDQAVCCLAVYAGVMTPAQFAAYMAAALPWCPSLTAFGDALRQLRARAQAPPSS